MDKSKNNSATSLPTRSKRSRTNLSNLRLAPLSAKYSEPPKESSTLKSPYDHAYDSTFARNHPSYIQGRSAPTSPGILSRSSSRRHLQGLSRRGSLYENEAQEEISYEYAGGMLGDEGLTMRRDVRDVPKAKSDAALIMQKHKAAMKRGQVKSQKQGNHSRTSTGGTTTPKVRIKRYPAEDDWLTRTGAAANAILQESKGQSWLSLRPSSATLAQLQDTTDEEDEGYEEMAAQSTRPSRQHLAEGELSPISTRASRWGSRYGSRTASRRTSRRGSMTAGTTGSRTPLAVLTNDGAADYFGEGSLSPIEADFVSSDEEGEGPDEAAVARFMQDRSFGLGGLVDRVMNFNIFKVDEKEELTEDEVEQASETEEQAKARMAAENLRKREAKEKLFNRPVPKEGEQGDEGEGGWSDAAWLLSVASKALF